MTANDLRQKYLDFFVKKGHKVIPSAPLVPEEKVELAGTQKVLFTTAGMHPLVPYLLGESHHLGKRLVNVQKCLRTDDIDEVGDKVHHTFFEMLGNWSLGDYWKKETIEWSFEFLTSKDWLGVDKDKLSTSVFTGDQDAPFDQESYDAWGKLGISESRIAKLPKKNNWWGPAGQTGPCGPDTEMFVWGGKGAAPEKFDPESPEWIETWNDVFMEYTKTAEGKFEPLKQKNVDTGMGLERMLAVLNGVDDDYQTELFAPIIRIVEQKSGKIYKDHEREFRIIADHLKAASFLISEGIIPSNKDRGYILRRLIRRSVRFGYSLGIGQAFLSDLAERAVNIYELVYPELKENLNEIKNQLDLEEVRFRDALKNGLKEAGRYTILDGKIAFDLYQNFGFPLEMTQEIASEKGQKIDKLQFEKEFQKHQELSRSASVGMFKGGLAEQSEQTIKYHTATHLLHAALRQILGTHVEQKGSNITSERLRFDFSHPQKMTGEELKKVEELVNDKIQENLPVKMETMAYEEAVKSDALAFFKERYGENVKVYSIGSEPSFSREVCGGPHVGFTGELGKFTIKKEETAGHGVRRIYAVLAQTRN
ncbi:MAG: alanine--tRNA ligase [bacterium]|nr:alanine--tRNA ligase [bacterium]